MKKSRSLMRNWFWSSILIFSLTNICTRLPDEGNTWKICAVLFIASLLGFQCIVHHILSLKDKMQPFALGALVAAYHLSVFYCTLSVFISELNSNVFVDYVVPIVLAVPLFIYDIWLFAVSLKKLSK